MEVLKEHTDDSAKEREKTGWEDLAELNKDVEQTTWEDVAESGDFEERVEAEVEPISLSDEQVEKLGSWDMALYLANPMLYTQVQLLKSKRGESEALEILSESLARNIEMQNFRIRGSGEHFRKSQFTLEQIADIYEGVGEYSAMLDQEIWERSDEEIGEMNHYFKIAQAKMPLEEKIALPRENMVHVILRKLRGDKIPDNEITTENKAIETRNNNRLTFLTTLINQYRPGTLDDTSLSDVSEIVNASIMRGDKETVRSIQGELGFNDSKNILRYAELLQSVDSTDRVKRSALERYYQLSKMKTGDDTRFQERVLPLLADERTKTIRAKVLDMTSFERDADVQRAKLDFAIEKVMPSFTTENRHEWTARNDVNRLFLRHSGDRNQLDAAYYDIENQILPFVKQFDTETASKYARRSSLMLADKLIDDIFEQVKSEKNDIDLVDKLRNESEKLKQQLSLIEELLPQVADSTDDDFEIKHLLLESAFTRDFEPDFVKYIGSDLFPKIKEKNSTLGSWARGKDYMRGEQKLRNLDYDCLVAKITPQEISRLLLEKKMLPTSDAKRLEQNRIDALAIEHVVVPNHSFIHDEHPLRSELLSAMVNYYDARGGEDFEQARQRLEDVAQKCPFGNYGRLDEFIYDLGNYEKKIKGEVWDDETNYREYNDPAINVLRRLAENTVLNETEIPEVDDAEWLKLMHEAGVRIDKENGKVKVDWEDTGKLAKYVNDWLLERQGEYGLDPLKLNAIAFTERAATYALRGVGEKERRELPYDENFKEFVKLQELTGSYDKFNPEEFERFWRGFQDVSMDDEQGLKEHYWRLIERELKQAGKLQKKYEAKGMNDAGMILQSDNLLHEIVMLMDTREPRTVRERMDEVALGVNYNKDEDLSEESK